MTDLTKLSDDELIDLIVYTRIPFALEYRLEVETIEEPTYSVKQEIKARLARLRELAKTIKNKDII